MTKPLTVIRLKARCTENTVTPWNTGIREYGDALLECKIDEASVSVFGKVSP
jgi:hypothetical protein